MGIEEWVGGGASEEDREEEGGPRFGRGRVERWGGGMRLAEEASRRGGPRTPPEALCAELRAGKEGVEGSGSCKEEEDERTKAG